MAVQIIQKVRNDSVIIKHREKLLGDKGGTFNETKEAQKARVRIKKGAEDISSDDLDAMSTEGLGVLVPRATGEALDFRRKQVLRLLLRGVAKTLIAKHLGISLSTVYDDIRVINDEVKGSVENIDVPLFVGMTLSFYDEIRNLALRMATDTAEKDNRVKLAALRVALESESDKHRYLALTGLYGVVAQSSQLYSSAKIDDKSHSQDMQNFTSFIQDYYHDRE